MFRKPVLLLSCAVGVSTPWRSAPARRPPPPIPRQPPITPPPSSSASGGTARAARARPPAGGRRRGIISPSSRASPSTAATRARPAFQARRSSIFQRRDASIRAQTRRGRRLRRSPTKARFRSRRKRQPLERYDRRPAAGRDLPADQLRPGGQRPGGLQHQGVGPQQHGDRHHLQPDAAAHLRDRAPLQVLLGGAGRLLISAQARYCAG